MTDDPEWPLPPCRRCWHNARQHGPNPHRDPEPGAPCHGAIEGDHGVLTECLCRGYLKPRGTEIVRVTGDRL